MSFYEDKLVGIKRASRLLGVSKDTLRNWDDSGKLKSVRTVGNHRRYKISDLKNAIGECDNSKNRSLFSPEGDGLRDKVVVYAYVCGDILHRGHLLHLKNYLR